MKHAVLVLALLLASGQRAHACDDFAPIAQPLGAAMGLGLAGGYVYGIAYFASHDLANDRTDNDYLAGDLAFNGIALWQMMHFDLSMGTGPFIISGIFQGLGIGLIFVPLSTLAFATVSPQLRGEGSSVYTLIRNLGGSAGISIMAALLTYNTQAAHSSMTPSVDPSNPMLRSLIGPGLDQRLEALNGEITRQAAMIAYLDDFKLMLIITIACLPMLLLMRVPKRKAKGPVHVEID